MADHSSPDFTKHKNAADRALALVSDLASVVGLGALASQAIKEAIERRRSTAREILIQAIATGQEDFEAAAIEQIDEFAGIALRYLRAVEEGARARNLKLLATTMVRQVAGGRANSNDFARKAAAVEGLDDDELQLLGEWLGTNPDATLNEINETLEYSDDRYDEARTLAAAMMRLGLVAPLNTWGAIGYELTPSAKRILEELTAEELFS